MSCPVRACVSSGVTKAAPERWTARVPRRVFRCSAGTQLPPSSRMSSPLRAKSCRASRMSRLSLREKAPRRRMSSSRRGRLALSRTSSRRCSSKSSYFFISFHHRAGWRHGAVGRGGRAFYRRRMRSFSSHQVSKSGLFVSERPVSSSAVMEATKRADTSREKQGRVR